jgi:hypothetical protein
MEKPQASGGRGGMESEKTKRVALYKRDDVRRLIDQLLKGSGGIEPRRDPNAGDYAFDEMAGLEVPVLLKELAAGGVLEEYRIDSVPVCPKCEHSNFFLNYSCPFCQHHNLDRRTMIEHYGCGHTDFESNFKSGSDLVCPKCSRTLKLIGTDYRKMDRMYHCSSCGRYSGTPNIQLSCRKCETVLLLDDAHTMPIFGYRLNEKLRSELVAHCALEAPIIDVLRQLGYEVKAPWVERGFSEIDHTFDIYAHNGPSEIVLDIASGTQEVGHESVFALFAKMYDMKPHRAILVAMPRLSPKAQRLSASYKIDVVGGASPEELVQRLRELLSSAERTLLRPASVNDSILSAPEVQPLETTPLAELSQPNSSVLEVSMSSPRKRMTASPGSAGRGS